MTFGALRAVARVAATSAAKGAQGQVPRRAASGLAPYHYLYVVSPPRKRIPYAEKVLLMTGMVCGWLAIPAWVLVHLDDYRGGPAEVRGLPPLE